MAVHKQKLIIVEDGDGSHTLIFVEMGVFAESNTIAWRWKGGEGLKNRESRTVVDLPSPGSHVYRWVVEETIR